MVTAPVRIYDRTSSAIVGTICFLPTGICALILALNVRFRFIFFNFSKTMGSLYFKPIKFKIFVLYVLVNHKMHCLKRRRKNISNLQWKKLFKFQVISSAIDSWGTKFHRDCNWQITGETHVEICTQEKDKFLAHNLILMEPWISFLRSANSENIRTFHRIEESYFYSTGKEPVSCRWHW